MRKALAALMVVCLLLPTAASAATSDQRVSTLHINHRNQTYTIVSSDSSGTRREEPHSLAEPISISLRPEETVSVVVDDFNPFFYNYALSSGEETPTANGEAAQKFASSLLVLIGGIDPSKKTAGMLEIDPYLKGLQTTILASFQSGAAVSDSQSDGGGTVIPDSSVELLTTAAQELKAVRAPAFQEDPTKNAGDILRYVDQKTRIMARATEAVRDNPVPTSGSGVIDRFLKEAGIPRAGAFLKEFKGHVGTLFLFVADINNLMVQVDQGKTVAAQAAVEAWDLESLEKTIEADYEKLHAVNRSLRAALNAEEEIRESPELADLLAEQEADEERRAAAATTEVGKKKKRIGTLALIGSAEKFNDEKISKLSLRRNEIREKPLGSKPIEDIEELEATEKKLAELDGVRIRLAAHRQRMVDLGDLTNELSKNPFFLSLGFILPYELDSRNALDEVKDFSSDILEIPAHKEIGTLTYSNLKRKDLFVVKRSNTIPEGVTPERTAKEYPFEFKPYSAVQLGAGGALVYSFVEKHEFSTVPSDGKFKIQETTDEYTGTNLAAMLTIVPAAWADSDFHPLFEVGVKPDDDLGIFGGVGFKFTNLFSVGAGVAFEQVEELEGGLDVGGLLDSADDLKTQKRFKTGFYIRLMVSGDIGGD